MFMTGSLLSALPQGVLSPRPVPLLHHSWMGKTVESGLMGQGKKPQEARLLATSWKCRERQHRRILMTFLSGVFLLSL